MGEASHNTSTTKNHPFKDEDKVDDEDVVAGASTKLQALWRGKKTREDLRMIQLMPILIIPAIAGSGLKIEKSALSEKYKGERVWMNVAMLAAGRLLSSNILNADEINQAHEASGGGKISKLELRRRSTMATTGGINTNDNIEVEYNNNNNTNNNNNSNRHHGPEKASSSSSSLPSSSSSPPSLLSKGSIPREVVRGSSMVKEGRTDSSRPTLARQLSFTECESALQVRSAWLHHMSLSDDMVHEREGNRVRPYEGLEGVEYMSGDVVTQLGSWVHAPVTKFLTSELGYVKGKNLDAAPYDWRVPPSVTEERDGYLTKTKQRIEQLYHDNHNVPVILLCHSMGCKMGHYFLNFAKIHWGQAWLDTYIHAYMPVGAPHCGVSLAVRAGLIGQGLSPEVDMMMDGDDEGLVLYRSWGSGAWLMPRYLPHHVLPSVICRREGELVVALQGAIDFGTLFDHRRKRPKELRLGVVFRKHLIAVSDYHEIEAYKDTLKINETYMFAVPEIVEEEGDAILGELWFFLEEPRTVPRSATARLEKSKARKLFSKLTSWASAKAVKRALLEVARSFAKSIGTTDKIGASTPWELRPSDFVQANEFRQGRVIELKSCIVGEEDQSNDAATFEVKVKYNRPTILKEDDTCDWPIAAVSRESKLPVQDKDTKTKSDIKFDVLSGHQVFGMEGFTNIEGLVRNYYENDPVGPKTTCATDAPPVKRVHAIYGINIPTEVCAVYRHRPYIVVGDDKADSRYILDTDCKLNENTITPNPNCPWDMKQYTFDNGKILETKKSIQQTLNEQGEAIEIPICGDGTVPYWNLQQCKHWKPKLQELTVDELVGAGHRDILAETRFHKLLEKYCKLERERTAALIRGHSSIVGGKASMRLKVTNDDDGNAGKAAGGGDK
jgi:hypothetical protein